MVSALGERRIIHKSPNANSIAPRIHLPKHLIALCYGSLLPFCSQASLAGGNLTAANSKEEVGLAASNSHLKIEQRINPVLVERAKLASVCITRLDGPDHGVGSGFLVRDKVTDQIAIMTARHVVSDLREDFGSLMTNHLKLEKGEALPCAEDIVKLCFYAADTKTSSDFRAGPRKLKLVPNNLNRLLPGMHFATDPGTDTALLDLHSQVPAQFPPRTLSFRDCSKDPISIGEPVFIVGNSGDTSFDINVGTIKTTMLQDASLSIVSKFIEVNMEIDPGDSGAPLLDFQGRVIGIVVKHHIEDKSIGYAIPNCEFWKILTECWKFTPTLE